MTSASSFSRMSLACLASVMSPTVPTCRKGARFSQLGSILDTRLGTYQQPGNFFLDMSGEWDLIPWSNGDLLSNKVPTRTDIDQIDA
jgi:hypothetical protein